MMQTFKLQIFLMSFFRGVNSADTKTLALRHKLNAPFTLMRRNTEIARFIRFCWLSHILQIFKTTNFTQITKRIVLFIAVFMIYMLRRPTSGHIKPCQPMRQKFLVFNGDSPIAHVCRATRAFADKIWPSFMRNPSKKPCFRVILKNRANMVNCNHELHFTIKVTI